MAIYDTLKDDLKIVDGFEAVTYSSVGASSTTTASVTHAVGDDQTTHDVAASGGMFQVGDRRWILPRGQLSGLLPKPGDYLTDGSSVAWHVVEGGSVKDALTLAYDVVTRKAR
jgi:hypothetical protein